MRNHCVKHENMKDVSLLMLWRQSISMIYWLTVMMSDWLNDLLCALLIDWFTIHCLIDWLVEWMAYQLTECLIDWLIGFISSINRVCVLLTMGQKQHITVSQDFELSRLYHIGRWQAAVILPTLSWSEDLNPWIPSQKLHHCASQFSRERTHRDNI